jgi:hypothetical protein
LLAQGLFEVIWFCASSIGAITDDVLPADLLQALAAQQRTRSANAVIQP